MKFPDVEGIKAHLLKHFHVDPKVCPEKVTEGIIDTAAKRFSGKDQVWSEINKEVSKFLRELPKEQRNKISDIAFAALQRDLTEALYSFRNA